MLSLMLPGAPLFAVEVTSHGVADLRIISNDAKQSYSLGGYGKFASAGDDLSLSQLGLQLTAKWDSGISLNGVLNAYSESGESRAGVTELYLGYKSLPNDVGYRWENRTGYFYPHISLENRRHAWGNVDTLNSSTVNTWVGEEIRLLGTEFKATRLGKFNNADYDISLTGSVFAGNDPAGALLAWHGWTASNRQTFLGQSRAFPDLPAMADGQVLAGQAQKSSPFREIDNRLGYQLQLDWLKHNKGKAIIGLYHNRAKPFVVDDGDYGWDTKFLYAGISWRLAQGLTLTSQALAGSTLMQQHDKIDVVNNTYHSAFVKLSKKYKKSTYTVRIEDFSVSDNDSQIGDNNEEDGNALTLNYSYQLSKDWLLSTEYNWIKSDRFSRKYDDQAQTLIERQLQFAAKYFF
ncbi:hypothetical protein WN093_12395 [Gammaproteobacteria bacterium AS21]